jgi:hypothetical protein
MDHWINIEEGSYEVESAFLLTPGYTATVLNDAFIEVYLNKKEERRVRGQALVFTVHIVELLEDHDDLDLLLDLGDEFKYLLRTPSLKAGKIFSPDIKSMIYFAAEGPLQKLSSEEYELIRERLSLVGE